MIACTVCHGQLSGRYARLPDGRPAHARCARAEAKRVEDAAELAADRPERLTRDDLAALATRPKTWGECRDRTGPCVWVGCRYHLAIDVTPTGRLVLVDPSVEPGEMAEPCALRVAERGEHNLRSVAALLRVTRQRVQQLELRAVRSLKRVRRLRVLPSGEHGQRKG